MRWLKAGAMCVVLSASGAARADSPVCIIGHNDCKTIVLLESAWGYKDRIAGKNRDSDLYLADEIGVLVNLTPEHGVGLSGGYTTLTDSPDRFVIRGRYRYWFSRYRGLDGSLGYIGGDGAHGVRIEGAIEAADHIGIVLGADVASTRFDGTVTEIGIAIRFGGFAGLPLAVLGYLAAGIGSG